MKRSSLLFYLYILFSSTFVFSQDLNFTYSENFSIRNGYSKIELLKNGNTAMFQVDPDGMFITLYNPAKKKIYDGSIKMTVSQEKITRFRVGGFFKIENELVVMLTGYPDKKPTLYRFIIDGTTGALKKEEKLLELPALGKGAGYAIEYGGVAEPGFYVKKDPNSDYYAILLFDSFASESNKRIEIAHYSPKHEQINRAFFTSPNGEFKYLSYMDIYVNADKYIMLSSFVYNTKSSGGEKSFLYVSKLAKGSTAFVNKELPYTKYFTRCTSSFDLDKKTGIVYHSLRTYLPNESKSGMEVYEFLIQAVNPDKMELGILFNPPLDKAKADYSAKIKNKKKDRGFAGLQQNYLIDQSGSFVVLNGMTALTSSSGIYSTDFEDMAFTSMTLEGKEKYGFAIPYLDHLGGSNFKLDAYRSDRKSVGYTNWNSFGYGSFVDVVPMTKYNYVLMNNFPKDKGALADTEPTEGTVAYKIDNQTGAYTKLSLFGASNESMKNKEGLFATSDFNKQTGAYVTMIVGEVNGKRTGCIGWVTLP
jgi:hypothetical protein